MSAMSGDVRDEVRSRYAAAALSVTGGGEGCCASAAGSIEVDDRFGAALYDAEATEEPADGGGARLAGLREPARGGRPAPR